MSKIHTTVRVGVDGSLTLPAFFMRGMGYEPGEEVPITTPANQYICDCDANRLLVTRTCDDAECTGYTSSGMELNLPAALLSEASIPVGEEVAVLAADGALIIVPSTEDLRELSVELCCLLHELGIECLAPCSKRIHTLLVIEHHVNHTGLGMPVCSDGGNGGGVDIFHQQF